MVNYDTLTNNHNTTLNQWYEYEHCYHPTEEKIKKKKTLLFDLPLYLDSGPQTSDVHFTQLNAFCLFTFCSSSSCNNQSTALTVREQRPL